MQEQAEDSSGAPPDYEGRIALDPTLLDVERLVGALETGGFELANTRVHQNLLLHHIGRSMSRSAILLREFCNMAVTNWHFSRSFRLIFLKNLRTLSFRLCLIILTTLVLNHFACSLSSQITRKRVYSNP